MIAIWEDKFLPFINEYTTGPLEDCMYLEFRLLPSTKKSFYGCSSNRFRIKSFFEMVAEKYNEEIFDIILISNIEWEKSYYSISFNLIKNF